MAGNSLAFDGGTTILKNAGALGTTLFESYGQGANPLVKLTTVLDVNRPEFTLNFGTTGNQFVRLSGGRSGAGK